MRTETIAVPSFEAYGGTAPENYERYFVPVIGAPLAADLIAAAALQPGERVLDVACGTGLVARSAAERVGPAGTVVGVDINPGMLAVARAATPPALSIAWQEAGADATGLAAGSFDAVLCQMGLQFFADPLAALSEMRRVLVAPGGRVALNVPGPTPEIFDVLAGALARLVEPEVARFVHQVFSLHEPEDLYDLLAGAGFSDISVQHDSRTLRLPGPADFLWQYVRSTPLVAAVATVEPHDRAALEREVVAAWQPFADDRGMTLRLEVSLATGVSRA